MKKPTINELLERIDILDEILQSVTKCIEKHNESTIEWRLKFDSQVDAKITNIETRLRLIEKTSHNHWWKKD